MVSDAGSRAAQRAATIERIFAAARVEFASHGTAATIRGVAARAGVDPSLVMQYFGSKRALFTAVTTTNGDGAGSHLRDVISSKVADPAPESIALIRSMFDDPASAAAIRAFLDERVESLAKDDSTESRLAAAMTVSTMFGLTLTRNILGLSAFENASSAQLESAAQRFLGIDSEAEPASPPAR